MRLRQAENLKIPPNRAGPAGIGTNWLLQPCNKCPCRHQLPVFQAKYGNSTEKGRPAQEKS